jgi:hypothetical protein
MDRTRFWKPRSPFGDDIIFECLGRGSPAGKEDRIATADWSLLSQAAFSFSARPIVLS